MLKGKSCGLGYISRGVTEKVKGKKIQKNKKENN